MSLLPAGHIDPIKSLVKFDPNVPLADIEREYIYQAMTHFKNIKVAARSLNVNRGTLRNKMNVMGIDIKTKVGRPAKTYTNKPEEV